MVAFVAVVVFCCALSCFVGRCCDCCVVVGV